MFLNSYFWRKFFWLYILIELSSSAEANLSSWSTIIVYTSLFPWFFMAFLAMDFNRFTSLNIWLLLYILLLLLILLLLILLLVLILFIYLYLSHNYLKSENIPSFMDKSNIFFRVWLYIGYLEKNILYPNLFPYMHRHLNNYSFYSFFKIFYNNIFFVKL